MTQNISIEVTPNVKKCLEILESAVRSLPTGDLKAKSEAALGYLSRTFDGEPQPEQGKRCPPGVLIIPNA